MKTKIRILLCAATFCIAGLPSCSDDNPMVANPTFEVVQAGGYEDFIFPPEGTDSEGTKITIDSNTDWFVELRFPEGTPEEDKWCSLLPRKGSAAGRVILTVNPAPTPYSRGCQLVATDMTGKELFSHEILQNGLPTILSVSPVMISSSYQQSSRSITVTSNVEWTATVVPKTAGEDVSWVSLGAKTTTSQAFTLGQNDTGDKRYAILKIMRDDDPSIYAQTEITQLPLFTINNAELITIADFLADFDNVIEDNVKVEGYVISDMTTLNSPDDLMFIQDESGRGMAVRFGNVSENTYALNQKVTVWCTGGTMINDAVTGGRVLTSLSTDNFLTEAPSLTGAAATPVELTSLAEINDYSNTLVKLKGVTFAVTVGTVFNGHATHADCGPTFLNAIRDSHGNIGFLRTQKTFTEKFNGPKTASNYDITAIVMPDEGQWVADYQGNRSRVMQELSGGLLHYTHSLRLRMYADMAVSAAPSPYTAIACWYASPKPGLVSTATSPINRAPAEGEGTFNVLSSGLTPSDRSFYALIDPSSAYAESTSAASNNTYWGYGKHMGAGNTYIDHNWEFSVSTSGKTGDIFLSFVQTTWGSAARYWKVQWSGNGTTWNDVPNAEYELWPFSTSMTGAPDLDKLYCPAELCYKLPEGAKNLATLHIRLQASRNIRAYSTSSSQTIATTGPTHIGFIGVFVKD